MTSQPEIVITGLGVVSPVGIGTDAFWDSLSKGESGIRIRPGFESLESPLSIVAPVLDFDGKKFVKPRKSIKMMCRQIQFGFAAAAMAIEHAALEGAGIVPERTATVFGGEAYYANPEELMDVFKKCIELGGTTRAWGEIAMSQIEPLWMLKYLPNMVASHISIALDARGPSNSIVQGESSSLLAIIEGIDVLQRGMADVAVVGATGSLMSETSMIYRGQERLSRNVDNPGAACRPFDADRDGMVAGEGAAALVIETREHAEKRGATVLARVMGFDRAFADMSQAEVATKRIAKSLSDALERGQISAEQLGHVNANGNGVVEEDAREAQAIESVVGQTPVFAPKSIFGNLGPATGAAELVASILAVQHGQLPGTLNFEKPDPSCPVNVCSQTTTLQRKSFVAMNQNHTGQIATLVLSGG